MRLATFARRRGRADRLSSLLALAAILGLASARPGVTDDTRLEGLGEAERQAMESIRATQLMPTIRFLSSNRLEGREAGTRGAAIAADYLVSRFQAAGLDAGTKDGFLQPFDLRWRVLSPNAELTLTHEEGGGQRRRTWEPRRDWLPFAFSERGEIEAPIVFAGYGIDAPEHGWDDYAAIGSTVRGKVVLVFRHEPDEEGESGTSFFAGREMTLHASLRQKARVAAAHGAVGIIVVDDPLHHEVSEQPSSSLSSWRILDEEDRVKPADDPVRFRGRPETRDAHRPLGILAAHASQEILRWLDPDRDWEELQRNMDERRRTPRIEFRGVTARLVHDADYSSRSTANVVAVLRGSDPELSGEYVLIGGHYDHVGKNETTGQIYNGADDNASGTAAVVAVAEAFAALPERPARSLLFVGWGAEEKGLLGSNWFARHPPVDLENVVAAINLDMVGRNDEDEMSVVGRTETADLVALFDRFAPMVGFTLNDDAGAGASRSDNASLWLGGIPTASLFSGTHEDYHEPSDTAGKVIPGKVERAARLTFLVANEIASGRSTPAALRVPAGPWEPIAPASRLIGSEEGGRP